MPTIQTKKLRTYSCVLFISLSTIKLAAAMSIDWHGVFGVDATLIDTYRKIEETTDRSTNGAGGSQELPLAPGGHANASFQSYLFKLEPTVIVNDGATFKAEFSSGYGRGGFLGDDSTERQDSTSAAGSTQTSFGNALYYHNTSAGNKALNINQAYMELYADTATYIIGRHTSHWALGAVFNDGTGLWDRIPSIRDGITMKVKLGHFNVDLFSAKIRSEDSLTRATTVKQFGLSLLYDNPDRDIAFGLLYSKKKNNAFNASIKHNTERNNGGRTALGETDTKLTDLYFKKRFGKFEFAVEVPLMSGTIGTLYGSSLGTANYKSKGILFESTYTTDNNWAFGFNAGKVSGDNGQPGAFSAMYLHPNYQVAELMFRYNLAGISDRTQSIYDSYMTNALYWKLFAQYTSGKWLWTGAIIGAKAREVATAGQSAYNSLSNQVFTAQANQDDDLGIEIDLGAKYQWNHEVTINSAIGYHMVGDYFSFTNDPTITNTSKNSYMAKIAAAISF